MRIKKLIKLFLLALFTICIQYITKHVSLNEPNSNQTLTDVLSPSTSQNYNRSIALMRDNK